MAIILSGDTHGMIDMDKVTKYFDRKDSEYTKEDYLIILGDAGILFYGDENDEAVRSVLNGLPVTTLWIDGNHENFDLLRTYPETVWHGGRVHMISDSIIHLMRGQIFEIDGLKFFTFGGANSIDKIYRREGISWWPEEMPSDYEYDEGTANLEKCSWKVDYILTHTCPESVAYKLQANVFSGEERVLQGYLQYIADKAEYKDWYFGHWHVDETVGKFHCLYNEIEKLL